MLANQAPPVKRGTKAIEVGLLLCYISQLQCFIFAYIDQNIGVSGIEQATGNPIESVGPKGKYFFYIHLSWSVCALIWNSGKTRENIESENGEHFVNKNELKLII